MSANLNVSLPEDMRSFVEAEVARGGYSTSSEYVRMLIREAQRRRAEARLEEMLLEGLNSGPGQVADEVFWTRLRDEVLRRRRDARKKT